MWHSANGEITSPEHEHSIQQNYFMTVTHNMISSRNMQISSPLKFNIPAPMGKIWLSNCKMLWYMNFFNVFLFFALSLLFFLHIVRMFVQFDCKEEPCFLAGKVWWKNSCFLSGEHRQLFFWSFPDRWKHLQRSAT